MSMTWLWVFGILAVLGLVYGIVLWVFNRGKDVQDLKETTKVLKNVDKARKARAKLSDVDTVKRLRAKFRK